MIVQFYGVNNTVCKYVDYCHLTIISCATLETDLVPPKNVTLSIKLNDLYEDDILEVFCLM